MMNPDKKKRITKGIMLAFVVVAFGLVIYFVAQAFAHTCDGSDIYYPAAKKCVPKCLPGTGPARDDNWKCIPACKAGTSWQDAADQCTPCQLTLVDGKWLPAPGPADFPLIRHTGPGCADAFSACGIDCKKARTAVDPNGGNYQCTTTNPKKQSCAYDAKNGPDCISQCGPGATWNAKCLGIGKSTDVTECNVNAAACAICGTCNGSLSQASCTEAASSETACIKCGTASAPTNWVSASWWDGPDCHTTAECEKEYDSQPSFNCGEQGCGCNKAGYSLCSCACDGDMPCSGDNNIRARKDKNAVCYDKNKAGCVSYGPGVCKVEHCSGWCGDQCCESAVEGRPQVCCSSVNGETALTPHPTSSADPSVCCSKGSCGTVSGGSSAKSQCCAGKGGEFIPVARAKGSGVTCCLPQDIYCSSSVDGNIISDGLPEIKNGAAICKQYGTCNGSLSQASCTEAASSETACIKCGTASAPTNWVSTSQPVCCGESGGGLCLGKSVTSATCCSTKNCGSATMCAAGKNNPEAKVFPEVVSTTPLYGKCIMQISAESSACNRTNQNGIPQCAQVCATSTSGTLLPALGLRSGTLINVTPALTTTGKIGSYINLDTTKRVQLSCTIAADKITTADTSALSIGMTVSDGTTTGTIATITPPTFFTTTPALTATGIKNLTFTTIAGLQNCTVNFTVSPGSVTKLKVGNASGANYGPTDILIVAKNLLGTSATADLEIPIKSLFTTNGKLIKDQCLPGETIHNVTYHTLAIGHGTTLCTADEQCAYSTSSTNMCRKWTGGTGTAGTAQFGPTQPCPPQLTPAEARVGVCTTDCNWSSTSNKKCEGSDISCLQGDVCVCGGYSGAGYPYCSSGPSVKWEAAIPWPQNIPSSANLAETPTWGQLYKAPNKEAMPYCPVGEILCNVDENGVLLGSPCPSYFDPAQVTSAEGFPLSLTPMKMKCINKTTWATEIGSNDIKTPGICMIPSETAADGTVFCRANYNGPLPEAANYARGTGTQNWTPVKGSFISAAIPFSSPDKPCTTDALNNPEHNTDRQKACGYTADSDNHNEFPLFVGRIGGYQGPFVAGTPDAGTVKYSTSCGQQDQCNTSSPFPATIGKIPTGTKSAAGGSALDKGNYMNWDTQRVKWSRATATEDISVADITSQMCVDHAFQGMMEGEELQSVILTKPAGAEAAICHATYVWDNTKSGLCSSNDSKSPPNVRCQPYCNHCIGNLWQRGAGANDPSPVPGKNRQYAGTGLFCNIFNDEGAHQSLPGMIGLAPLTQLIEPTTGVYGCSSGWPISSDSGAGVL